MNARAVFCNSSPASKLTPKPTVSAASSSQTASGLGVQLAVKIQRTATLVQAANPEFENAPG